MQEIKVSRTWIMAFTGLCALCVSGIVCTIALFIAMAKPDLSEHVGAILTTSQVIVGALAATAGGGALAHGGRHWGAAEPSAAITGADEYEG